MSNVTRVSPLVTANVNAFANPAASGDNAIVAAVAGGRIRVLAVTVIATLANNVKFRSATTDISATMPLGANGGFVLPFNEHGWFQTNVGEALNLNMTVATATGVQVHYIVLAS
jgi:hypothetical protein